MLCFASTAHAQLPWLKKSKRMQFLLLFSSLIVKMPQPGQMTSGLLNQHFSSLKSFSTDIMAEENQAWKMFNYIEKCYTIPNIILTQWVPSKMETWLGEQGRPRTLLTPQNLPKICFCLLPLPEMPGRNSQSSELHQNYRRKKKITSLEEKTLRVTLLLLKHWSIFSIICTMRSILKEKSDSKAILH